MSNAITFNDAFFDYIYEANHMLDNYVEIDSYQMIFEEQSEEVKDATAKNESLGSKIIGTIKAAIGEIKKLISRIGEAFTNLFTNRKIDEKEREDYNKFKEAVKLDPSLKDKKVTITDFRNVRAEYEKLMNEVDAAVASDIKNDTNACEKLMEKVKNFGGGALKGASVTVTMDVAWKIAAANRDWAKMLNRQLKNDKELCQMLEDSVGKINTMKFKHDIRKFSHAAVLKRASMAKKGLLVTSVTDAIEDTLNNTLSPANIMRLSGNKEARQLLGTAGKAAAIAMPAIGRSKVNDAINDYNDRQIEKRQQSGDYRDIKASSFIFNKDNRSYTARNQRKREDEWKRKNKRMPNEKMRDYKARLNSQREVWARQDDMNRMMDKSREIEAQRQHDREVDGRILAHKAREEERMQRANARAEAREARQQRRIDKAAKRRGINTNEEY